MSNTTTTKTNGQAPKDSAKGAAVMKAVTATAPNPVGDRINAIAGLQRKVLQLQRLKEVEQELRDFKLQNSEGDSQHLRISDANNNRFETTNAYIVQRVVEAIQAEVRAKVPQLETEILNATL